MIIQDERRPEEKISHSFLIIGTDTFLSGWGEAEGGKSYAAWGCEPKEREKVLAWVNGRSAKDDALKFVS